VAGSIREGERPGPGPSRRRLLVGSAIGAVLLSGAIGCGARSHVASSDAAEDVEELVVSVADDVSPDATISDRQVEATGPGDPEVTLVRSNGGVVRAARGDDGSPVLSFPHEGSVDAPVAILALSSDDPDWLQPHDDQLVFGADLTLDEISDGSATDNGDNVMQRGLFGAPAQFKLQVDHRVPSCLVRGDAGMVLTKSSVTLEPRSWYRVTCQRTGDDVKVTVSKLEDGDADADDTQVDSDSGEIGSVTFPAKTLMSIGGKLGPNGGPVKDATDQFDGSLSRIHVSVEETDR
jgi:hypothetical protein